MPDYDPEWGARMQKKYGATEQDLQDPGARAALNRRAQKDRAQTPAQTPPAQTPPAQTPQTPAGGTESQPKTTETPGPFGGGRGGTCADGSIPTQSMCQRPPCPSFCKDGSSPSGGSQLPPGQKPPPGQPGPYPPPGYPPPPGQPSGYGQPYYGGPGTSQRAGYPGSGGYGGYGGQIYQNSPMSYPPPGPFGYGQYPQGPYGPYGGGTTPPGQYPQYPGFNPAQGAQAMVDYRYRG